MTTAFNSAARAWRADWRLTLGVLAAISLGYLGANTMPLWLGPVIDGFGLGSQQAGLLGSAELFAAALALIVVAPLVAGIPRRRLAFAAGTLVLLGYWLSAEVETYAGLVGVRVLTGFCAGIVLATGNASAAGGRDPDRIFAAVALIAGVIGSGVLAGLGYAAAAGGYSGVFLTLAFVCAIAIPLLVWLPALPDTLPRRVTPRTAPHLGLAPLALLGALFVLNLAGQGIWAFTERIGVGIGLGTERIALWLAAANAIGLISAGAAMWLGTRLGRTLPICLGLTLNGLSQWVLVHAGSENLYALSQVGMGLAFYLWTPFAMGIAAALDHQGRWTVAAGGTVMLGVALGPWVAGAALEQLGSAGMSALVVGSTVCGLALLGPVSLALDRAPGPPGVPGPLDPSGSPGPSRSQDSEGDR